MSVPQADKNLRETGAQTAVRSVPTSCSELTPFLAKISRFCTWYLKCPFRNQTKTGAEMCPGAPVRHIGESIGARVVFGADPVLVKICSFCSWYLKCSFRNQVKTGIIVYRSRVFVRIQSISIASCFCKGSVT